MSQKTAICIVGPICSGKSTLAEMLSAEFNIPCLTETVCGGLMGILDHLDDHDCAIIEHCELLNFYDKIADHFASISVIYIQISEELMQSHIQKRIAEGGVGDFMTVDPIKMKQDIEKQVYALSQATNVYTMQVDSDVDYPMETERIVREIRSELYR